MNTITFDEDVKEMILECFEIYADEDGFLRQTDNHEYVLDYFHKENIHIEDFAGVLNINGKRELIKGDITSIIGIADYLREQNEKRNGCRAQEASKKGS